MGTSPRNSSTRVSVIASPESCLNKVLWLSGEVTWPMLFVTSQPRPSTLHARILTRSGSAHSTQRLNQSSSSLVIWPQVVPLVPHHSASSILLILQEPDLLLMLDQ